MLDNIIYLSLMNQLSIFYFKDQMLLPHFNGSSQLWFVGNAEFVSMAVNKSFQFCWSEIDSLLLIFQVVEFDSVMCGSVID